MATLHPAGHKLIVLIRCRGKRKGVYGAYLLAVYEEDEGQFQTISKIGTGFSEQLLIDLADSFKGSIIEAPRPDYLCGNFSDCSIPGHHDCSATNILSAVGASGMAL